MPSTDGAVRSQILVSHGLAVMATTLIMPLLLYVTHLAAYGRLLYPLVNFALAGYLFARRSPWYAGHCLLIFCFVSLVRRLVDEQAGWDPSNPVLLTPYLCCIYTCISFVEYWLRPKPRYLGPFLTFLLCIGYAALLATLNGRVLGMLVDMLKWTVGPLFAVYILAHREYAAEIREVVESILVWAGMSMAVYGIVQFIDPPTWDAAWMRDVVDIGLTSIGRPEPFAVRVFSTMNSPGSFGVIMSAAIVVALKRGIALSTIAVSLMSVGLALCQYRSIWAATVLAVAILAMSRRAPIRRSNMLALLVIGLAVLATTATPPPQVREVVAQRASSVKTLKGDASLQDRLHQYASLVHNEKLVFGEGLAINGASRRLDNHLPAVIDGAFIEIWYAMGIVIGTIFIFSLGCLIAALFSASAGRELVADRAIVVALFVQLPIGSVHVGEVGFCAWMFMGFGLAALAGWTDRSSVANANASAIDMKVVARGDPIHER